VTSDNKSHKLLDKEPIDSMTKQINNIVKTEKPEIIKVDLLTEDGHWVDGSICDLRPKTSIPKEQSFQGLGEAEINALVERRFDEKKKEDDYLEMKDIVKDLAKENDELKAKVNELEEKNEELEQDLANKKKIRYYAGLLGDILESVGISKDKLRKPLIELMGIDEKKEQKKLPDKEDKSGIVEETETKQETADTSQSMNVEEQKRFEVITLIGEFLKNVNSQLLAEIFSIFSEIESNHALAPEIIEYITKRKEFAP
jgi:Rad3-related DNA helicase